MNLQAQGESKDLGRKLEVTGMEKGGTLRVDLFLDKKEKLDHKRNNWFSTHTANSTKAIESKKIVDPNFN